LFPRSPVNLRRRVPILILKITGIAGNAGNAGNVGNVGMMGNRQFGQ